MLTTGFDTETSWMHDFKKDIDDSSQPFPLELGLCTFDENRNPIHKISLLIKPAGMWDHVHPDAQAVHGRSFEDCEKMGVHPMQAFHLARAVLMLSDMVVGHNLDHDLRVMGKLAKALGQPFFVPKVKQFCTMRKWSESGRKLPGDKWNRWPKLEELFPYLTGKEHVGAHSALADAFAAVQCHWKMIEQQGMGAL